MKRVHVNVRVEDLDRAVGFYTALFGARPDIVKDDYVRFRLDEPSVNFSISRRGGPAGVDHMGIDVDTPEELAEATERLRAAGYAASDPADGVCCYARLTKSWSVDPAGVPWETFHTHGASVTYGADASDNAAIAESARRDSREISTAARAACC